MNDVFMRGAERGATLDGDIGGMLTSSSFCEEEFSASSRR